MMKPFKTDRRGLFQDNNTPVHRARGATKLCGEYENDVNHMLWPSLSPDLNSNEHLREILEDVLDSVLHRALYLDLQG